MFNINRKKLFYSPKNLHKNKIIKKYNTNKTEQIEQRQV